MPIVKLINASETFVNVPNAEFQVLKVLASLNKEVHGPAISRASNGSISVAAIYKLLSRLEKRSLVQKREEHVQVGDITAKRMLYKLSEAADWSMMEVAYETRAVPAGRAVNSPLQEVSGSATSVFSLSS